MMSVSGSPLASRLLAPWALVGAGLGILASFGLEAIPGRPDGDNPALSLSYLRDFGHFYALSGLAIVVTGVMFVISAQWMLSVVDGGRPSLAFRTASTFAIIGAAASVLGGVMRLQAVGTVPHMEGLDRGWGESAYLVVQIAGTQGAISMALFAFASWMVALAVVGWRRGVRAPVVVAILPAFALLSLVVDLVVPSVADAASELWWLAYMFGLLIGTPMCAIVFGVALTRPKTLARYRGTAAAPRGGSISGR